MIEHVKKVLADPKRVCPAYDPKQGYELPASSGSRDGTTCAMVTPIQIGTKPEDMPSTAD